MRPFDVVCLAISLISTAFAVKFYRELFKWARQCQYARIAISFKGKVKLHAPLTEWIAWINLLDKDKDSNGRVVYRSGGTAVAITKKVVPAGRIRSAYRQAKMKNRLGPPPVQEGSWSAKDQTPEDRKVKL